MRYGKNRPDALKIFRGIHSGGGRMVTLDHRDGKSVPQGPELLEGLPLLEWGR